MDTSLPVYNWGDNIPETLRLVEIHAQDGVYVRGIVKMGNMKVLEVVGKTSSKQTFSELPPMTATGLNLYVNKIPTRQFKQIVSFFHYAYHEFRSEAVVLLFLNPTLNGGTWEIQVPKQTVTAASVSYQQPNQIRDDWLYAGTMHSHGGMRAFHSTTDNHDEDDTNGFHLTWGAQGDIDGMFMLSGWKFTIRAKELICVDEPEFPEEWKSQIAPMSFSSPTTWYKKGLNKWEYKKRK